jgi:DNA-binding NtrC family response regulator
VSPSSQLRDLLDRLVGAMVEGRITFDEARRVFEARYIEHALDACDGHVSNTAERIGIHRNTLARKITEYRIRVK